LTNGYLSRIENSESVPPISTLSKIAEAFNADISFFLTKTKELKSKEVLAAEWINGKGGITVQGKKYKIELLVEDNKNTAPGYVNAATKLVHKDKVNSSPA